MAECAALARAVPSLDGGPPCAAFPLCRWLDCPPPRVLAPARDVRSDWEHEKVRTSDNRQGPSLVEAVG